MEEFKKSNSIASSAYDSELESSLWTNGTTSSPVLEEVLKANNVIIDTDDKKKSVVIPPGYTITLTPEMIQKTKDDENQDQLLRSHCISKAIELANISVTLEMEYFIKITLEGAERLFQYIKNGPLPSK